MAAQRRQWRHCTSHACRVRRRTAHSSAQFAHFGISRRCCLALGLPSHQGMPPGLCYSACSVCKACVINAIAAFRDAMGVLLPPSLCFTQLAAGELCVMAGAPTQR